MNPPRINNDERGVTLNKSLAWTIATGLVAAGLWLGTELASTKEALIAIREEQAAQAADRYQYRRETDGRLRALETSRAGDDQRIANMLSLLARIDSRLERIEQRTSP